MLVNIDQLVLKNTILIKSSFIWTDIYSKYASKYPKIDKLLTPLMSKLDLTVRKEISSINRVFSCALSQGDLYYAFESLEVKNQLSLLLQNCEAAEFDGIGKSKNCHDFYYQQELMNLLGKRCEWLFSPLFSLYDEEIRFTNVILNSIFDIEISSTEDFNISNTYLQIFAKRKEYLDIMQKSIKKGHKKFYNTN
ncbi:hypothetical protein EDEG_03088 [Edhazardia aedis USNM 41457]|uniref:Uncharacterized protein n=1 Tax=Edhazardia aedis (strain USNM 41457) TaxID=1003232 RepID=J9DMA1_EDHAE|nr:hypothetical protein EDEG_03088 [Edhazardia aedis USNM 41457]|eukprot:EJW02502.1 hypothetical protein EDEG_03088 [Edhazardia aedis USNM 41457]